MNRSETVTMFNDMCLLAPATLIDRNIHWEELGPLSVKATFSHAGNTIGATLRFNEEGELVNFASYDRSQTSDGKVYRNFLWSTPVRDYRDFGGVRLASYGEGIWSMPEGGLVYGRFRLLEVEHNVRP